MDDAKGWYMRLLLLSATVKDVHLINVDEELECLILKVDPVFSHHFPCELRYFSDVPCAFILGKCAFADCKLCWTLVVETGYLHAEQD